MAHLPSLPQIPPVPKIGLPALPSLPSLPRGKGGRPKKPLPRYTEEELYLISQQHGEVCYLIHFHKPIFKQISQRTGQPIYVRHYLGTTSDLRQRIEEHKSTTWEPFEDGERKPGRKEGSSKRGQRHGKGAVMVAYANYLEVGWSLVRVWNNAGHEAEKKLKGYKKSERLCPLCWGGWEGSEVGGGDDKKKGEEEGEG